MRNFTTLVFVLSGMISFAQPPPSNYYPERIAAITEQLKTDSLNYYLIWERLQMQVNLLGGFGDAGAIFSTTIDSLKAQKGKLVFDEFNADFNKLYNNAIKVKNYDIVEEGDFYLNRIFLYFNTGKIEQAIADARYLRDSASYSRYWQRGDYYNNWALYALYNLYIVNKQYQQALEVIDSMLQKKKRNEPDIYFSGHGSFLSSGDKIKLFEHFNKTDSIIPFLKQTCIENFNWYFSNAEKRNYSTQSAKQQSFSLLKQIINYMEKYNHKELAQYKKLYNDLLYKKQIYESIDPSISDSTLRVMVSQIQ